MKDHIQLLIPPGLKDSLLLSKGLSIIDFLQFPLPGIAAAARESTQSTACQPKTFFSTLFPTIMDPKSIQKILLPPLPILKQLSQDIDLTSTHSIICQHAPAERRRPQIPCLDLDLLDRGCTNMATEGEMGISRRSSGDEEKQENLYR